MNFYILLGETLHFNRLVLGIYSSKEEAFRQAKEYNSLYKNDYIEFYIESREMDGPATLKYAEQIKMERNK